MKRPTEFANAYLDGGIDLPMPVSSFGRARSKIAVLEGKYIGTRSQFHKENLEKEILSFVADNKLNVLKSLKLNPLLEYRIYIALDDLFYAIIASSESVLKIANREVTTGRKKIIKYLEKILAVKLPILLNLEREALQKILDGLNKQDRKKDKYHPIKEVEYYKELIEPTVLTGLWGNNPSYKLYNDKMERLLLTSQQVDGGRPQKFFYMALPIVMYKYLRDAGIAIEKAKHLAKDILNEYRKKKNYLDIIPSFTYKKVDNSLHSS